MRPSGAASQFVANPAFGTVQPTAVQPASAAAEPVAPPMAAGMSVMSIDRGELSRTINEQVVLRSRWRKTPTTFGPVGRVIASLCLIFPLVFFVIVGMLTGGMTVVGALIWGAVIMPWGLRDTWRAGMVPTP